MKRRTLLATVFGFFGLGAKAEDEDEKWSNVIGRMPMTAAEARLRFQEKFPTMTCLSDIGEYHIFYICGECGTGSCPVCDFGKNLATAPLGGRTVILDGKKSPKLKFTKS